MDALNSSFALFRYTTNRISSKASNHVTIAKASVKPPPPNFDYRTEILKDSATAIAKTHPELLDLARNGSLVLIEKRLFGAVPPWRDGAEEPEAVWLIGTAHISEESAAEVERVVREVKPENVVVELCRSRRFFRAGIMYVPESSESHTQGQQNLLRSNMFSLSGTGFFGAVVRSIDLGGQTALALRLLLALFSSKISSDVNRPFGDEFRAARKVAEEVGAQIVLGDRPIEITLERAWNSLTWTEKLSFVTSVLRGITSPSDIMSQKNIKESSSGDDSTFQLYEQLSFSYPSLLQPLIHERDTYLAWSLKRSKAVKKSKRVVGVIGKGHMNGVIYALVSDQPNLRFRDLAGKSPNSSSSSSINSLLYSLLRALIRDTLIGLFLWALYQLFTTQSGLIN